MHLKSEKAFTLAEVLITLGVIGVVAAITIPTIVKNYSKHVIETRLRQTYSLLQNAINLSKSENGENYFTKMKVSDGNNVVSFMDSYIFKYMKVALKSKISLAELGYKTPIYKQDQATIFRALDSVATRYVLSNGCIVLSVANYDSGDYYYAAAIVIDLNGVKNPNTIGKDVFRFNISYDNASKSIIDTGNIKQSFNSNTLEYLYNGVRTHEELLEGCSDISLNGIHCTGLLVENGWKFPKDYPLKF